MIKITAYQGATVGVYGLGLSGLACVRALLAGGAQVLAWDDKQECRDEAARMGAILYDFAALGFDKTPQASQTSQVLQALIVSPAVSLTHPAPHPIIQAARAANIPILGDMALFAQAHAEFQAKFQAQAHAEFQAHANEPAPIIAITGTNGKSTTTALIAHLLNACGYDVQMGGNIGKPVLDLMPPSKSGKTIYVLELSSYQIDLSPDFTPHIAILLNLSPDHIERHGDYANYIAAKWQMFENLPASAHAIIGIDGEKEAALATQYVKQGKAHLHTIAGTAKPNATIYAKGTVLYDKTGALADFANIPTLQGAHNLQNAAASFAALCALNIPQEKLIAAFADFPGLAHRLQPVAQHQNIQFINDSKATNAEATSKALAAFENIYWIAGGQSKQGGIESLSSQFQHIRYAYLIGTAAEEFAFVLGENVPHKIAGTLDKAVPAAAQEAARAGGGVILFSPACASFDQFDNFEMRGDAFCRLAETCVIALAAQKNRNIPFNETFNETFNEISADISADISHAENMGGGQK
ncbi:MAG: UDP-N-acetylmuramoyl-L-alanine--D-glutamate ligase [Alphaproteobacteria bacterium]|nr:UDP-N-acetylmuramoyl-L-alanine--D-glutamate ligase [Alphaproteobacteria bacterium]